MNKALSRFLCALILIFQTLNLSAVDFEGPVTEPLPYQDVEFPQWAHDMRRFEVIMFGAFPITYILSSLVYDVTSLAGSGFNSGFSLTTEKGQDDLEFLLLTSASLSVGIAVADLIIGKVKKRQARNLISENTYSQDEE